MEQSMDHDALCVAQAHSLIEEGFMDEEFACYGTVFIKDGNPRYYVSSTDTSINRVFTECLLNDIYPAPPKYFVMRTSVPSGMREEIRQKFKYRTAQNLKLSYPACYFKAMQIFSELPANNQAMPLLHEVKAQLENRFDDTALALFKGIVQHALTAKHITKDSYRYWMLWLTDEYHKMEGNWLDTHYYHRTYSGYGTIVADGIVYSQNAFEPVVTERRNKEISAGKLVTPLIQKRYYASSFEELKKTKNSFVMLMQNYLNDSFADIMHELYLLESAVPKEIFMHWYCEVQKTQSQPAIDSLNYYKHIWNIKFST